MWPTKLNFLIIIIIIIKPGARKVVKFEETRICKKIFTFQFLQFVLHSIFTNQIKSNQITFIVTSPQHKCLGEWNSYERAPDSAEKQQTIYLWTDSAKKTKTKNNKQFTYGQTVQKNNNKQFTYGQTVQKKQQTIYIWTDSAKKTANNLHMDRQCKKTTNNLHMDRQCKKNSKQFTYGQTVQKKQQLQFTYGQTVQKNNSNLHMDSTYLQTVQKTMCKIHIHILSTLSVL